MEENARNDKYREGLKKQARKEEKQHLKTPKHTNRHLVEYIYDNRAQGFLPCHLDRVSLLSSRPKTPLVISTGGAKHRSGEIFGKNIPVYDLSIRFAQSR